MQRTTLSRPSTDEVTTTGRSRSARSAASSSNTWKPFISGISMSSSSRSKGSRLNISMATRPFSASATEWPCCSRLRERSRRLTLLSSATSSRPLLSRIAQLLQRGRRSGEVALQRIDCIRAADAAQLQRACGSRQRRGAEGQAVGFERVRSAAEGVNVSRVARLAQRCKHARRFLEEGVHQLGYELSACRLLQLAERGLVDHRFSH